MVIFLITEEALIASDCNFNRFESQGVPYYNMSFFESVLI